jgi:hypothetical protein
MSNLYGLRTKWAAMYRDSFTADMNSTQRSEGMNNVFKKRFRRKLSLSELLAIVFVKMSWKKILIHDERALLFTQVYLWPQLSHTQGGPIESLRKNLKHNFHSLVNHYRPRDQYWRIWQSDYGATVVFNKSDLSITCSCRKFDSIVMFKICKL